MADAHRYELSSAALQTANGRFVAPDDASLRAAADLLKPDTTTGTWPVPTKAIATNKSDASAYPGTMVVYAAIPTTGLSSTDASDYAALLRFAAGPGQQPGLGVGELPPGYLPMTSANGLGQLASYTLAAAGAVAAQKGALPALTGRRSQHHTGPGGGSPSSTGHGATGGPGGTQPGGGTIPPLDGGTQPTSGSSASPTTGAATSSGSVPTPLSSAAAKSVPLGKTPSVPLSGAALAVVIALLLAAFGLVATPASYLVARWRGKQ